MANIRISKATAVKISNFVLYYTLVFGLFSIAPHKETGLFTAAYADESKWADTIAEAKQEGEVTLYTGLGLTQMNDLARRFERKYGIRVQVVRAVKLSNLLQRLMLSRKATALSAIF